MSFFATVGHRAWWAYNCLTRDAQGKLPARRALEQAHGLSNGDLKKLIWDQGERLPNLDKARREAQALNCSMEWLFFNEGEQPRASWPIPPRPDKPEQRFAPRAGLSESDVVAVEREMERAHHDPSVRRNR